MRKLPICFVILAILAIPALGQRRHGVRATGSGGPLLTEQAAYDVKSYDLDLRIDPATQSIRGSVVVKAQIVHPTKWFVLDLDPPLLVDSVELLGANGKAAQTLTQLRRENRLWIAFPMTRQPGELVQVRVVYGGKPRVAPNPPWVGGFLWTQTREGQPWVNVACQNDGADLWIPVKDHPSDEPESVSLRFTVPQPLIAASNGRLLNVTKNSDGTQTFHWQVLNPINNYNIALNVAPYRTIEDSYTSITGDSVPVAFWILPEDYDKGAKLIAETKKYLKFFEDHLGPFPFRNEKIGIVQTKHLGMEHQTSIAYGNNFAFDSEGFDWLMFHELGHEWFGNLITASDWRDFWIHEGFQSFLDTYYMEKTRGKDAYFRGMANRIRNLRNMQPVAPRESRTTVEMYMAAPDYVVSDGDIYGKGAVILHTLRYLLGDDAFFTAMRRMTYPDPVMEKFTDGRQVRFVTTDDYLQIAEAASKQKLDWFFELYLRQPALPRLISEQVGNQLSLRWETPNNLPFPMPVEVQIGNETKRYEMPGGKATISIAAGEKFVIDPNGWILKQ